jgi:hypothetical protein
MGPPVRGVCYATAGFPDRYESLNGMLAKLFGAASRKPMAGLRGIDVLVYESYGLTDAEIRIAQGGEGC